MIKKVIKIFKGIKRSLVRRVSTHKASSSETTCIIKKYWSTFVGNLSLISQRDARKTILKKSVFLFSLQLLFKTFLILKRI